MKVMIIGQNLSIGESLRQYVDKKMNDTVGKYVEHPISTHVHFVKDGPFFKCDIMIHEGIGPHSLAIGDTAATDIYAAFDAAMVKCEQQLRKHKSKLKDRHHKVKLSEAASASLEAESMRYQHAIDKEEDMDEDDAMDEEAMAAESPRTSA